MEEKGRKMIRWKEGEKKEGLEGGRGGEGRKEKLILDGKRL